MQVARLEQAAAAATRKVGKAMITARLDALEREYK
jgi:hypothetical protein